MTQVHETYNVTPFIAEFKILTDCGGGELLIAVLKASFDFDEIGNLSVSPRDRILPVMTTDRFYVAEGSSSVQYPTDLSPVKEGTDIIVNGYVYGNGRKKVTCGFKIGNMNKILTVTGHRVWNRVLRFHKITGPFPFDKIPLVYENAFGGQYEDKRGLHRYEFNPVGKGYGARHLERALLPNIEFRDCPVRSVGQNVRPAGLGAIPSFWKQRLVYAGTYDNDWKTIRFPLPPLDMKPMFYNTVPQDQVYRPKLKGSERLTLFNLYWANPELTLPIPVQSFTAAVRIKNATVSKPMEIDTCLIESDEHRMTMTYTARFAISTDSRYVKSVLFKES
jgi:hypothetical protein